MNDIIHTKITVKENSLVSSEVKRCEFILFSAVKKYGEARKTIQIYEEICSYSELPQSEVVKNRYFAGISNYYHL